MQRVVQVAIAAAMLGSAMAGSATRAEAQLPTVQQIYDKYATAVGGRDAWSKVAGRTEKGTADITFAGLSGSYLRYIGAPNRMRMTIDLGVVQIDQGYDGEKGWAQQGQGAQRMPADQEKNLSENLQTGAAFLDPSRFTKAEVQGKEAFDGVDAYKVAVTTKAGIEQVEFFDVATGLRIGTVATTPMGPQRVIYRDYKDFEGKKLSTKVVQNTPQGDVIINITAVTFGSPDPAVFKAPADLK
jgi:hypothetical protein